MASRSLLSNVGPRGARGHRRFDREREARHHERHLIARGSQSLVHEAEEIAEAKPLRRLGMDTLADFVADEDDIPRAAADERRQIGRASWRERVKITVGNVRGTE